MRELLEKRAKALADARAINEAAKAESRDLTPEEEISYNKAMDDYTALHKQVERENTLAERQAEVDANRATQIEVETPEASMAERQMRAFESWLVDGNAAEYRALQADADVAGGYITAPQKMVSELLKAVDDDVVMRRLSRKFQLGKADSLGVPSLANDPADADWTSELLTGSEDSTMDFGKRELFPSPCAKLLKVSNKLMRNAVMSPEALVRDRLAYKFGITHEKAFLTGTGVNQPLGVFTASAQGISTGRDVSTGNTTTAFTVDGLKEAKYTLKPNYHGKAQWLFHRDSIKLLAKLKDGNGRYLWEDQIRSSEPSRLLGFPINMSENAPNTFTTGLYVGLLGDFSKYWIADALSMQIQRLNELYAATNQVGFIGRLESDGMPVLEEAFVRVTLA